MTFAAQSLLALLVTIAVGSVVLYVICVNVCVWLSKQFGGLGDAEIFNKVGIIFAA